jgi:hypothetical protein
MDSSKAVTHRQRIKKRRRPDERRETQHVGTNVGGLDALQQLVGNRAVQRMLAQRAGEAEAEEMEAPAPIPARFLSGPHWLEAFPASDELKDLMPGFRLRVLRFIYAVEEAGGEVEILSTEHPPELAYLMHWAWRIAKQDYDPQKVPVMDGLDIHWWHGDARAS